MTKGLRTITQTIRHDKAGLSAVEVRAGRLAMATALSEDHPDATNPAEHRLAQIQFGALLFCAVVAATCNGAWMATLSVYFESRYPSLPASAVTSMVVACSYLSSVVFAGRSSARSLRWALGIAGAGLALLTVADVAGLVLLVIGAGWARPCILAQVAALRPPGMSVSRAFAVYSGLLNAGWMCGGIGADFLRFGLGWAWLFRVLAFLSILGVLVATRLKPPKIAGTSARDTPLSGGIVSVVLILSVAVFYLASAQFVTSVPLIVEGETMPLVFVGLGALALKAGTLGGLHGGFVLALTLWQSARPGSAGSPIMLALGLLIIAASFAVLALLHYPTIPVWIVVVVAAMSVGETISVNHMLALGSRLAGFGRSAYWIAATVGYAISGSWGMLWKTWTHRGFFAVLALVCIVVGAGMLLALTRARRSP